VFAAPKVVGIPDEDIDPDGNIPIPLLLTGIKVIVPLWPQPAKDPGERDVLTVVLEQAGHAPVRISNTYYPQDMQPEFLILIGPEHLKNNGECLLRYELLDTADNPANSHNRKLTIDHTPVPVDLDEATFTDRNDSGYLNCKTARPFKDGVRVEIPPLRGFRPGDRCEVLWRGYDSLNGSGVEFVRARKLIIRPAISEQDIREGYALVIEPAEIHVKPLVNDDSAIIVYSVYRGAKLVGKSKTAIVKIDRVRPGSDPCWSEGGRGFK
jgi:hypothetical protein